MRIGQKALFGALVSAALFSGVTGFTASGPQSSRVGRRSSTLVLRVTPEEERAALLSDYLARAHEEKLKAVQAVEAKKDAEINSLKEQLQQSQTAAPATGAATPATTASGPPSVGANVEALSKDELVSAVKSYQQFMAKYIVDAQEQKTSAVKAAEAAAAQKYEAKLQQLSGSTAESVAPTPEPAAAPAPAPAPTPVAKTESPPPEKTTTIIPKPALKTGSLYAQRNARLAEAAAAGKSRWGKLEVARAEFLTERAKTTSGVEPATAAASREVPAEVEAADHGLRNDGGVGGLTLAERVAMGAGAGSTMTVNGAADASSEAPPSAAVPAQISVNENLFQQRNVKVAAAAKAGKSRWGEMEVMRIQNSVSSVSESRAADIVAADHGLQPDQGHSLADRVNLGARLLGK